MDDLNFIGYTKDISGQDLLLMQSESKKLLESIFSSVYYFGNKRYVKNRCSGIGVLNKKDALDAGVTGPCLRASGITYDSRITNPYLSYLKLNFSNNFDIITFTEGDVFARVETRIWEMKNSYALINLLIDELVNDETKVLEIDNSKSKLPANEIGIANLESPQGELVYYLKSGDRPGKANLGGIYIFTPSQKNFQALNKYILKDNHIKDFPLIVHSMDLNFNEIDL